jgi:hypothetical protein
MAVTNEKRVVGSVVFAFLAGMLFTMTHCDAVFADQAKSKTKATVVRMGTLLQVDSQFVIKSGRTTYQIAGRDLSPWAGKKVKVTGTMSRTEKGKVLEVTKIEEVKRTR